jgi:hypothetical protein
MGRCIDSKTECCLVCCRTQSVDLDVSPSQIICLPLQILPQDIAPGCCRSVSLPGFLAFYCSGPISGELSLVGDAIEEPRRAKIL